MAQFLTARQDLVLNRKTPQDAARGKHHRRSRDGTVMAQPPFLHVPAIPDSSGLLEGQPWK